MYQVLPGIKRIGYVSSSNVPGNVVSLAMAGITINISSTPNWLCLGGSSKVTMDETYDNNAQYQKGTLEFKTEEDVPDDGVAFIVEDVEGHLWLFGQAEIPNVEVERKKSSGQPANESAGHEFKVKFSAKKVLIPCALT